jgi:hypothetical protein
MESNKQVLPELWTEEANEVCPTSNDGRGQAQVVEGEGGEGGDETKYLFKWSK